MVVVPGTEHQQQEYREIGYGVKPDIFSNSYLFSTT